MKNRNNKSDMLSTDFDVFDKFEFEEHDDLSEFFEDLDVSDTRDLV